MAPPQIMACTDPNCGCGMRATGVSNAVRLSLQLEETNENLKALTKQSEEQQAATEEHMTTILTAQGELVTKIQEKIPLAVVESLLSEFEHSQWKGRTILPEEMRRLLESAVTTVLQEGQAEMNAGIQASVKELGESIGKLQEIPVAGPVGGNAGVGWVEYRLTRWRWR